MSQHFSHLQSLLQFFGIIIVGIVVVAYLPRLLGKVADLVAPTDQSHRSADQLLSGKQNEQEREKSKPMEGQVYYSQKNF